MTIEITGTEDKIDGLLEVLRPYGVIEMARTGRVAMSRGVRAGAGSDTPSVADLDAGTANVSYSV
jgi:hypothetical protein